MKEGFKWALTAVSVSVLILFYQNCSNPGFETLSQSSLSMSGDSLIARSSKNDEALASANSAASAAKLNCPSLAYNIAVCQKVQQEVGDTCRIVSNSGVILHVLQGSTTMTDITINCTAVNSPTTTVEVTPAPGQSGVGSTVISDPGSTGKPKKLVCPSLTLMMEKCAIVVRDVGDTCRISSTEGALLYTLQGHNGQTTDIWTPCHLE
ncbi:MAG: hypothetical protein OM95_03545 [Bdellovibrio sp. ArHS]|uniref:hypothetical protein n=1 Tax=Bdellovibrio sp. ArHS TaxID=1569284 RepID=UPI000582F5DD|nr:hypothetical protein [Bdellovibrio sp. ArHS]KHD89450.1 MAG: hypothetical protein OM95_03545 [Bdellovibrio sp. ArHS]